MDSSWLSAVVASPRASRVVIFSCSPISDLDSAFEGHLGRSREPDRLAGAGPVYAQLTAARVYLDTLVQSTVMSAHRDGCACARATRQRFAGAALVDAQVDVRAIEHFHEAHVHAFRKTPMTLDGGAEA